uniref:Fibronectin type III domain protein n=1 Tax=Angiostrongylus cantonensis TaxID=6313 RepID=A0A158P7J6_ANGCA
MPHYNTWPGVLFQDDFFVPKGFKVYFTRNSIVHGEKLHQWQHVEVLTSEPQYCVRLDADDYDIKPTTVYRIRASVLVNQVESAPSKIILLDTREAVIKPVKVFANGSAILEFVPGENVGENYVAEYREVTVGVEDENNWRSVKAQSNAGNRVTLSFLMPNRTYEVRLLGNDHVMNKRWSRIVTFTTNNTAQLPQVTLDPERISVDPDVSLPLEVRCNAVSIPLASIRWLVDDKPVEPDHLFYTISNVTIVEQMASRSIRMKFRTRNSNLTCVATNAAGQVSKSVIVRILGPGSPPSSVTVKNERGGYTVSWLPPLHPNGNITKYVVYHSFHKDDPLSDWQKVVLDSTENSVRVLSHDDDGFYVRVQAAADSGPGVISDIVAIEKDTNGILRYPFHADILAIPVTVSVQYIDPPGRERLLIEPEEKVSLTLFMKDEWMLTWNFRLPRFAWTNLKQPSLQYFMVG